MVGKLMNWGKMTSPQQKCSKIFGLKPRKVINSWLELGERSFTVGVNIQELSIPNYENPYACGWNTQKEGYVYQLGWNAQ